MAYNYRYRPTVGHPKSESTVILYFIDYDSYGWPSFGVDNSNNDIWSVPDYIGAGTRQRDLAGVKDEGDEYTFLERSIINERLLRSEAYFDIRPYDFAGTVNFEFEPEGLPTIVDEERSDDQYPNDLLKVRHLARSDNGELDWIDWTGSSFGSSMTYNYSVLNERYGTQVDPVEEDFQNLLYLIKENKPEHLKGIVIVPLKSKYTQSVQGNFTFSNPLFVERLRLLQQRIEQEELQDLFVITEPQWTGENNTVSSGGDDMQGCCPYSYDQVFKFDCPFQFPSVDPTQNPDPNAPLEQNSTCSDGELDTLDFDIDEWGQPEGNICPRAYLGFGFQGGAFGESFYGCKGGVPSGFDDFTSSIDGQCGANVYLETDCNTDTCTTPSGAYDGSVCHCKGNTPIPPEECIGSGDADGDGENDQTPTCPNVSMECLCSYSYQTPSSEIPANSPSGYGYAFPGYNDFWRSPSCSPFVNDFSQVIIDAVDQLTSENEKFRFLILNNKRQEEDSPQLSTQGDTVFYYGSYIPQGSLPQSDDLGDPIRENRILENFYDIRNRSGTDFTDIYITLNSLYDYYGSENAVQLKNNFLVGQMNELRQQIIAKDWLSEIEIPTQGPFAQRFHNYQCWKYIGEVTEENYKSLLKDTRGYGPGFFGSKCPHTLFQRPSERVKFFFPVLYNDTFHIQRGYRNFHRIPERDGVNAETYVNDDSRYYHIRSDRWGFDVGPSEVIDIQTEYSGQVVGYPIEGSDTARERISVRKGSSGMVKYGQYFLQHIIQVINNFVIFTPSYPKRFEYAEKVCEMIYKQKRTPMAQGFFSVSFERTRGGGFESPVGDPGDFFSFNDEIYYDPFDDLRNTYLEYFRYGQNPDGTFFWDESFQDGLWHRSMTNSLYKFPRSRVTGLGRLNVYPQLYYYPSTSSTFDGGQGSVGPMEYDDDDSAMTILQDPSDPLSRTSFINLNSIRFYDYPTVYGFFWRQGEEVGGNRLYRGPYPPPFDNYTEDLTVLHEESTPQDRFIRHWSNQSNQLRNTQENIHANCNCWDTSVLAPYVNIEGNE